MPFSTHMAGDFEKHTDFLALFVTKHLAFRATNRVELLGAISDPMDGAHRAEGCGERWDAADELVIEDDQHGQLAT